MINKTSTEKKIKVQKPNKIGCYNERRKLEINSKYHCDMYTLQIRQNKQFLLSIDFFFLSWSCWVCHFNLLNNIQIP